MKIAFVGKGGSGKTTLAALLCRHLATAGRRVLAIDADINQHLGAALGLAPEEADRLPPLGLEIDRIKDYLRGSNPRIASTASMIKTTPPGRGSRLITPGKSNPIFEYFMRNAHGVGLMAVGPFAEADIGTRCYHSKTGAVELLLNHMIDGPNDHIVVDMTAGADAFASGLFTRFDITFLVAEPTLRSLGVHDQYRTYAADHGVAIEVVGNKIEVLEDLDFIAKRIGRPPVAAFGRSAFVRSLEKGRWPPLGELEPENQEALDLAASAVDGRRKDWHRYQRQAIAFHRRNAASWGNAAIGEDLSQQIDDAFDLAAAARRMLAQDMSEAA